MDVTLSKLIPLALGATMASALPVLAQQQGANWVVSCSNVANPGVLACGASQSVVLSDTGARLVTVEVVKTGNQVILTLVLPLGLLLSQGAGLSVDGALLDTLPIRTCEAQGCFSQTALSEDTLNSLRTGDSLVVTVSNTEGNTLDFTLPLDGFAGSYAIMP